MKKRRHISVSAFVFILHAGIASGSGFDPGNEFSTVTAVYQEPPPPPPPPPPPENEPPPPPPLLEGDDVMLLSVLLIMLSNESIIESVLNELPL